MSTSQTFSEQITQDDSLQLHPFVFEALNAFKKTTRYYARFPILFSLLSFCELLALALFFSFLTQSTLLAFTLATLLFTAFSYFILSFYLQAKKPQELLAIKDRLMEQCQTANPFEPTQPEYYEPIALILKELLSALHRQEYTYYALPQSLQTLSLLMRKFSVWMHWKDLHKMKESLLFTLIQCEIENVKLQPIDLGSHARLVTAYRRLAQLYRDPRAQDPEEEHLFISPEYTSAPFLQKFQHAAKRAIEELKILDAYAPETPWVQHQLASLYRDLEQPQEEIRSYETLLKISPQDPDLLLQLGILYFQQGQSASALKLYATLKEIDSPKAEELISYYDSAFTDEL